MVALRFKSLKEINDASSSLPNLPESNPKTCMNSMRTLLEKANMEYLENQNENAYFLFFRFFEMHNRLKRSRVFKENEKEFYKVIGGKQRIFNAMTALEKLGELLKKEYDAANATKAVPSPIVKELSLRDKVTVSDLNQLKEKGVKHFLLCEVRSEEEYYDNHVNWNESLLIPPMALQPGIIPQKLGEILPEGSRKLFASRCQKDYIIFMDNSSKKIEDNTDLVNLKQILSEWEGNNVHHNIIICEGGFDKFSMAYPLQTTKKTKSSGFRPSSSSRTVDIKNLTYPEVDKNSKNVSSPPQHISKSPAFTSGAISFSSALPGSSLPSSNEPPPNSKPRVYEHSENVKETNFRPNVPDRSLKANIIKEKNNSYNEINSNQSEPVEAKDNSKMEENNEMEGISKELEKESNKLRILTDENRGLVKETSLRRSDYPRGKNINSPLGSNINRSYSSPNIPELAEKEEEDLSPNPAFPIIHVDRSTKPSSQIKRNFDHIWSSGQTKRGLTGLKNLGNTCYMNSILQCISNFTVMAKYFLENKYLKDINKKSETRGNIANEYSALLQQMWSGNVKSISPSDMKRVIGMYNSNFSGYDQQDAHEFFLSFMLWLHNDVNEIQEKVTLPEQKTENAPSKKAAAKKAWEYELSVDKSFIRQIFYGQRKSTLQCLACHYESSRYDSFIELSLELPPGNRKVTLAECIKLYLEPVSVTWTCSKCKHNGKSLKKFDLVKLPLILTIHLARFFNDGLWRKKQNVVEFELEHVNFGRYVTTSEEGTLNTLSDYNLYGVCNHFGSMEGGHYTAYCYSQVYSKWHKYDDHEVHEIDRGNVVTAAAYVLFYAAKN